MMTRNHPQTRLLTAACFAVAGLLLLTPAQADAVGVAVSDAADSRTCDFSTGSWTCTSLGALSVAGEQGLAVGDLDGAHDNDIVFEQGQICFSDGSGGYECSLNLSLPTSPAKRHNHNTIALADVDGEAGTDFLQLAAQLCTNSGSGTFTCARQTVVGGGTSLEFLDLDGMNQLDIVSTQQGGSPFDGDFRAVLSTGGGGYSMLFRENNVDTTDTASADFDLDGDIDIYRAWTGKYCENVSPAVVNCVANSTLQGFWVSAVGTFDAGNYPDIFACKNNTECSVFLNDTAGGFISTPVTVAAATSDLDVVDLDGDGDLDVLLSHRSTAPVSVCLNNAGTFTCTPAPDLGHANALAVGIESSLPPITDSDGDGANDDVDNCPDDANPGQEDHDGDGVGDACDACPGLDDAADVNGNATADCLDACGGAAFGQTPTSILCYNQTQRRHRSPAAGTPWDCEAAGMPVTTGDSVAIYAYGDANNPPAIGGGVTGMSSVDYVRCTNRSTGQRVYPALASPWDCEAAGLVVGPGDRLRMTVVGTAK